MPPNFVALWKMTIYNSQLEHSDDLMQYRERERSKNGK
jgi:hypothetical protein